MNSILNTTEAELLINFEKYPSIESLANSLNKDPTVISRQLKKIGDKGNFLVKQSGRWKITSSGIKLNQLTREYIFAQNKITKGEVHIKIGATREFSAQILGKNFSSLKSSLGTSSISLISNELGVEESLLSGEIDLGFDCGRPFSPDILFKRCVDEPISAVVSREKFKEYKNFGSLESLPHILCERVAPEKYISENFKLENISSRTNDIATAKSLCLSSEGWALLPNYSMKKELASGELKIINDLTFNKEKFGVYCLRHRKELHSFFERSITWLKDHAQDF